VGCEIGLCAFVRPRVPCVPCVSRLPPVSFYRCVAVWAVGTGEKSRCGLWGVKSRFLHANLEKHKGTELVVSTCSRRKE